MPREFPEVPELSDESVALVRKEYVFDVITPMFGGGSIPREHDENHLVRGSAIRGSLRFWWRATRGAQRSGASVARSDEPKVPNDDAAGRLHDDEVKRLHKREVEIWGGTDLASHVRIAVRVLDAGELVKPNDERLSAKPHNPNPDFAPYALFPFMPQFGGSPEQRRQAATGRLGIRFSLLLSYPENLSEDVETALWAWANFGGIGGRTRRGCGALFCANFAPENISTEEDLARWYAEALNRFNIVDVSWSTLSRTLLVKRFRGRVNPAVPWGQALGAWKNAVAVLAEFRQGQGLGRNPKQEDTGRPGRSRWPEADSLRRIQRIPSGLRHSTSITTEFDAFPRAEFGLPIVFHFQGKEKEKRERGDPGDTTLYPSGEMKGRRLASPLILRPFLCQGQDSAVPGSCFSVILRLATPAPDAVRVESTGRGGETECRVIRDSRLTIYDKSPMANRSPSGSAVEAFLHYAEEGSDSFKWIRF